MVTLGPRNSFKLLRALLFQGLASISLGMNSAYYQGMAWRKVGIFFLFMLSFKLHADPSLNGDFRLDMQNFTLTINEELSKTILYFWDGESSREIFKTSSIPNENPESLKANWSARMTASIPSKRPLLIVFSEQILLINHSMGKAFSIPKEDSLHEISAYHSEQISVFFFMNVSNREVRLLIFGKETGKYFWYSMDPSRILGPDFLVNLRHSNDWDKFVREEFWPFAEGLFGSGLWPEDDLNRKVSFEQLDSGHGRDLTNSPFIETTFNSRSGPFREISEGNSQVQYSFNFGDNRSPLSARRVLNSKGLPKVHYIIPYSSADKPTIDSLDKVFAKGVWISFPEGASGVYYFVPDGRRIDESLLNKMKSAKPNLLDPK